MVSLLHAGVQYHRLKPVIQSTHMIPLSHLRPLPIRSPTAGTIPPEIGGLGKLTHVRFSNTDISGESFLRLNSRASDYHPARASDPKPPMKGERSLTSSSSHSPYRLSALTGVLPESIGKLVNLKVLWMNGAGKLSGKSPTRGRPISPAQAGDPKPPMKVDRSLTSSLSCTHLSFPIVCLPEQGCYRRASANS